MANNMPANGHNMPFGLVAGASTLGTAFGAGITILLNRIITSSPVRKNPGAIDINLPENNIPVLATTPASLDISPPENTSADIIDAFLRGAISNFGEENTQDVPSRLTTSTSTAAEAVPAEQEVDVADQNATANVTTENELSGLPLAHLLPSIVDDAVISKYIAPAAAWILEKPPIWQVGICAFSAALLLVAAFFGYRKLTAVAEYVDDFARTHLPTTLYATLSSWYWLYLIFTTFKSQIDLALKSNGLDHSDGFSFFSWIVSLHAAFFMVLLSRYFSPSKETRLEHENTKLKDELTRMKQVIDRLKRVQPKKSRPRHTSRLHTNSKLQTSSHAAVNHAKTGSKRKAVQLQKQVGTALEETQLRLMAEKAARNARKALKNLANAVVSAGVVLHEGSWLHRRMRMTEQILNEVLIHEETGGPKRWFARDDYTTETSPHQLMVPSCVYDDDEDSTGDLRDAYIEAETARSNLKRIVDDMNDVHQKDHAQQYREIHDLQSQVTALRSKRMKVEALEKELKDTQEENELQKQTLDSYHDEITGIEDERKEFQAKIKTLDTALLEKNDVIACLKKNLEREKSKSRTEEKKLALEARIRKQDKALLKKDEMIERVSVAGERIQNKLHEVKQQNERLTQELEEAWKVEQEKARALLEKEKQLKEHAESMRNELQKEKERTNQAAQELEEVRRAEQEKGRALLEKEEKLQDAIKSATEELEREKRENVPLRQKLDSLTQLGEGGNYRALLEKNEEIGALNGRLETELAEAKSQIDHLSDLVEQMKVQYHIDMAEKNRALLEMSNKVDELTSALKSTETVLSAGHSHTQQLNEELERVKKALEDAEYDVALWQAIAEPSNPQQIDAGSADEAQPISTLDVDGGENKQDNDLEEAYALLQAKFDQKDTEANKLSMLIEQYKRQLARLQQDQDSGATNSVSQQDGGGSADGAQPTFTMDVDGGGNKPADPDSVPQFAPIPSGSVFGTGNAPDDVGGTGDRSGGSTFGVPGTKGFDFAFPTPGTWAPARFPPFSPPQDAPPAFYTPSTSNPSGGNAPPRPAPILGVPPPGTPSAPMPKSSKASSGSALPGLGTLDAPEKKSVFPAFGSDDDEWKEWAREHTGWVKSMTRDGLSSASDRTLLTNMKRYLARFSN